MALFNNTTNLKLSLRTPALCNDHLSVCIFKCLLSFTSFHHNLENDIDYLQIYTQWPL